MAQDIIVDASDFERAARAMHQSADELARGFESILLVAGRTLQGNIRRNVMAIPSSNRYTDNVREAIAAAVVLEHRAAGSGLLGGKYAEVKVYVDEDQLPAEHRPMARLLNQRRFRHPVYGNDNVWVDQSGRPYIRRGMLAVKRSIQEAIQKKMEGVVQRIDRAT